MNPKNNFIYKLTDRLGLLDIFPLGESSFSINYSKEDNDSNFDYKKEMSGKMTLKDEAFSRLMSLENSVYRCDEQIIEIFKDCNGIQKLVFSGRISLNEAEFNLDKCFVVIKFMKDSKNKCYDDNKTTKVDLMLLVQDRVTIRTASFAGTLETKTCIHTLESDDGVRFYWCGTGTPEDGNWTATSTDSSSPDNEKVTTKTIWAREIIEIDCSATPESDWVLVEDNCSTTSKKKFAKIVDVINCVRNAGNNIDDGDGFYYEYNCEIIGYNSATATIDNGLKFSDFMTQLISFICPDLTLKSDFFQINPDVETDINYVTNKVSKVNQIIVFQKSDVKRPNDSQNARKLETTAEAVLNDLFKLFNVKWRIIDDVFRIEHVSFFAKNNGFDITSEALKKYFIGKRVYSYDSTKIPEKETFDFKEKAGKDWTTEVIYSGCVSNSVKNETKVIVEDILTDIIFALNNPDSDNKSVEDVGMVFVSTTKTGSDYLINSEASPNGRRLNNVFAFNQLFRDYFYYNRPMKTGKVNGTTTQFLTTIPTKKGEQFAIPYFICEQNFNPDDVVKTALGNGIVDSANLRLKDSFIELNLLYESNQDLVPNDAPILTGGGVYTTFKNIPITIPISATDADGFISSIKTALQPNNGIVEIISFSQIKYTPNLDFQGFDNFILKAFDNQNEFSGNASFGINILAENSPPIAKVDNFNIYQGETFVQPFSILDNDTDDFGSITLLTTSATTNEGIVISINSSGFFNYTPTSGFEGNDFFNYTIEDNIGNQSTGVVNLKVGYKNKPIAVDDNYQTAKNTSLTLDGTVGKEFLIANDYCPDGVSTSFTTTAETKSTAQSGSVTIGTDGSFVYTPPTDFVGIDSFDYQVNNVNGSDSGSVSISVLQNIYVKLVKNNTTTVGRLGDNYFKKSQNYILEFYSDNSGTTPINVSGMNFKVKIKENQIITKDGTVDSNNNYIYFTSDLSGTSTKILDQFVFVENQLISGVQTNLSATVTIETSPTYQII